MTFFSFDSVDRDPKVTHLTDGEDHSVMTMVISYEKSECNFQITFLNFVPVDNLIARKANNLPNYSHRDPADRMIIATALSLSGI